MIKKFFPALALVLFATSMMAQTGLTCEDPIPVGKDFRGTVEAGSELWYSAWTYDLPLHVYFSPDVDNSTWGPEVVIDFTCEEGVYDDPKVDSVVNQLSGFGLELPVEFLCDKVYRNGKVEWDLVIDESYRERLTEVGITYNIQAYVRVYFTDGGEIRMTPDTSFQSCVNKGHFVRLGDTIEIAANDAEQVFVLPYADWQNDSIQFTWIGDQSARVWVAAGECDFTPVTTSAYYRTHYDIAQGAPHKLQPAEIQSFMETNKYGGIYFGKVVSKTVGKFVVEKIPLGPIQGDAILLKHGESVALQANDERVFCFPKTWKSTEFLANTQYLMAMHVSNTPDFTPGDANVICNYAFGKDGDNRQLQLSAGDISSLGASAKDDYLYVRFVCNKATTLTPSLWTTSTCSNKSILIKSGEKMSLKTSSSTNVYRLRYEDWKGYDFSIKWNSYAQLSVYIADACDIMMSSADPHVIWSKTFNPGVSATITAAELEAWASRVDKDGLLYVRVNPKNTGNVTFTSAKPAETDPEGPVLDPIYTTISETLCYGESYEWNGQTYSTTGEYKQSFVATNGADSIVTLQLTILPEVAPTKEEATIEVGESYTWNGKEYTEAGEYPITLQDKNGCDYQATLVLKVNKPLSPCLQSSIKLNVGDEVVINLDSAFTVYAIDYAAWMAQPVTLVWIGTEALHTFVAETCVFALAPYNKYVHAYVPVPAQGDSALDMEALAPYVDEDGYLYVRFLTEFEGVLTVK